MQREVEDRGPPLCGDGASRERPANDAQREKRERSYPRVQKAYPKRCDATWKFVLSFSTDTAPTPYFSVFAASPVRPRPGSGSSVVRALANYATRRGGIIDKVYGLANRTVICDERSCFAPDASPVGRAEATLFQVALGARLSEACEELISKLGLKITVKEMHLGR